MNSRRLKVTNEQIDQRCKQLQRIYDLKQEQLVRAGYQEVDQPANDADDEPLGVGDTICWDGLDYRIDMFTADGVVLSRIPRQLDANKR